MTSIGLVLAQVLRLVAIGLAIGIVVVLVAGGALEGLLFGVRAADPVTIAVVTLTLAVVALLAAWVPAARASRVDPIQALRWSNSRGGVKSAGGKGRAKARRTGH